MENPFFKAPFFKTKCSNKIFENSNYIGLCVKTAFGNNSGPWEVPKPEKHESESAGFLVWAIPAVQNCFRKQFYTKSYIITILIFFLERFVLKIGASKSGFPIVFLKCDLTGVG